MSANGSQSGLLMEEPIVTQHKKKKKDKKNKKDKEHKHHHHHEYRQRSHTPISHGSISNNSEVGTAAIYGSPNNGDLADDQALSESELESKRAALLAQLNEQMEE